MNRTFLILLDKAFMNIRQVPVAALYHGGYWKQQWTIDNTPITSIVPDLLKLGFAVVEVEYRRRDDEGGGWPGTNNDAMLALNSLPDVAPDECATLDLTNVTLIGHSAGGCLVLWLAAQELLAVRLALVVAVAPVCDLNEAYHLRLSDEGDAVERYMKCTPETEEGLAHYAKASPAELVPNIQVSGNTHIEPSPLFVYATYGYSNIYVALKISL
jgi:acetyl esterase/lipase